MDACGHESFGEAISKNENRRMASIMAGIPCSCCFLHRDDFDGACEKYPEAAGKVQAIAAERFRDIWDKMDAEQRFQAEKKIRALDVWK